MPRAQLIRQSEFPYHVIIRTSGKSWFKISMHEMWEICYESLLNAYDKVPVEIHCFVLMSNHYHLLISTPDNNIDKYMEVFNRRLSNEIKKRKGAENHKFANRYKWSIVKDNGHLQNVYRYIYQNPVRAGLCECCIDYPYSSLRYSVREKMNLGLRSHIDYFKNREWMDQKNGEEFNDAMRKALRRKAFQINSKVSSFIQKKLKGTRSL